MLYVKTYMCFCSYRAKYFFLFLTACSQPELMLNIYRGDSRVEAGYITSAVVLRIVGGDEKEPRCLEYNCATCYWGT
jgi:hypothetical protein